MRSKIVSLLATAFSLALIPAAYADGTSAAISDMAGVSTAILI
jgi:hypothetical protein